jgi:hypothetical protein
MNAAPVEAVRQNFTGFDYIVAPSGLHPSCA